MSLADGCVKDCASSFPAGKKVRSSSLPTSSSPSWSICLANTKKEMDCESYRDKVCQFQFVTGNTVDPKHQKPTNTLATPQKIQIDTPTGLSVHAHERIFNPSTRVSRKTSRNSEICSLMSNTVANMSNTVANSTNSHCN